MDVEAQDDGVMAKIIVRLPRYVSIFDQDADHSHSNLTVARQFKSEYELPSSLILTTTYLLSKFPQKTPHPLLHLPNKNLNHPSLRQPLHQRSMQSNLDQIASLNRHRSILYTHQWKHSFISTTSLQTRYLPRVHKADY